VPVSQPSATPAIQGSPTPDDSGLRAACNDAITELQAARRLISSQDALSTKAGELLALERQIADGLRNLRVMDAAEKQKLRDALVSADKETAAVRAENEVLKKKRMTLWKKVKWFVIGGAAGVIAGTILSND
jgi:hypothetical protein